MSISIPGPSHLNPHNSRLTIPPPTATPFQPYAPTLFETLTGWATRQCTDALFKTTPTTLVTLKTDLESIVRALHSSQDLDPTQIKAVAHALNNAEILAQIDPTALTPEAKHALGIVKEILTHLARLDEPGYLDTLPPQREATLTRWIEDRERQLPSIFAQALTIIEAAIERHQGLVTKVHGSVQRTLGMSTERQESAAIALDRAQGPLQQLLEKGIHYVEARSLHALSSPVLRTVDLILTQMQTQQVFPEKQIELQQLRTQFALASEAGDVKQCAALLQEMTQTLSTVNLYINGVHVNIPAIGTPAVQAHTETAPTRPVRFSTNLERLDMPTTRIRASLHAASAPREEQEDHTREDWMTRANEEKQRLISNTADYLSLCFVFEKLCGFSLPHAFYIRLIQDSKTAPGELREVLLRELRQRHVSLAKRCAIQVLCFFYRKTVKACIRHFLSKCFEDIFNYINTQRKDNFTTLRKHIITCLSRYLGSLNGAYHTIANDSSPIGPLDELIAKQLKRKEANADFEPKELYKEVLTELLKKALGSSLLAHLVRKVLGDEETLINSFIDKALAPLSDGNGYTHALSSVISGQLEEILRLLENGPEEGDQEMEPPLSAIQKRELKTLIEQLFSVIEKDKCTHVDQLKRLLAGNRSPQERMDQMMDSICLEQIVGTIIPTLFLSLKSFIQEDRLLELTYHFAQLANQGFEASEEEIAGEAALHLEERKVEELSKEIVQTVIESSIHQVLDFTGTDQHHKAQRWTLRLQGETRACVDRMQSIFGTLVEEEDLSSTRAKESVELLHGVLWNYENQCASKELNLQAMGFNDDNQRRMHAQLAAIASESHPLCNALGRLRTHSLELQDIPLLQNHLATLSTAMGAISNRFHLARTLERGDLRFLQSQLAILEGCQNEIFLILQRNKNLAQMPEIAPLSQTLHRANQELKQLINAMAHPRYHNTPLDTFLPQWQQIYSPCWQAIQSSNTRLRARPAALIQEMQREKESAARAFDRFVRWAENGIQPISALHLHCTQVDPLVSAVQDTMVPRISARVQERFDGVMQMLKQDRTYRFGLLHHLCLIPYAQYLR